MNYFILKFNQCYVWESFSWCQHAYAAAKEPRYSQILPT
jgi:hypothetical protein